MNYSQQMYNYGEGRYRFISHVPLQKGDLVHITGKIGQYEVESVEESRDDKGKWKYIDKGTGKQVKILTNIIKIKK